MKKISAKDILRQLKYDLIGKDSYRGVTLTYSWLANQFGHFGLGFIPAYITFVALTHYGVGHPAMKAAFFVWGFWIAFETYNCIKPILFSHTKTSIFPAPWRNIIYDVLTDLSFFGMGAFLAAFLSDHLSLLLIFLVSLAVLALYPSYDWYRTKMYQQEAGYPFQFRLSQWASTCTEENKQTVLDFIKDDVPGKHLFIFGAYKSGKTSLSVAIANECSITKHACKYVTAMKIFSLFFEPVTGEGLWDWRDASLLVIDDLNPGFPLKDEVVTPASFMYFIDQGGMGEANKKTIREKKIIWVLGVEDDAQKTRHKKWQAMLLSMGVGDDRIFSVNL